MTAYYVIGRNGTRYYYNNGKRISSQEGIRLNATRRNSEQQRQQRRRRPLKPCKPEQYRHPVTNRCRKRPNGYISPSNSPQRRGNCINRSKMVLKNIQSKVVTYMNNNRSLLVVHGTGCGKTLTAITASQCYLDRNPRHSIVFIGPSPLVSNFKKEMKNYGVQNTDKYELYSYDKVLIRKKRGDPITLRNKMLIIDEVHNLRNIEGQKTIAIMDVSFEADKCLLLSATPYVNKVIDFISIINILYGRMIVGTRKQFENNQVGHFLTNGVDDDNLGVLRTLLRNKVDFVSCRNEQDFPKRIDHTIDVPMSMEYYERYKRLLGGHDILGMFFRNPRKFLNGFRRAVNVAGGSYFSEKIQASIPILRRGKSVIYTNWISYGAKPITDVLRSENISFRVFSGSVNNETRKQIIEDFNEDKFNTLIITKAGGEGIDLKGVSSILVLEPPWNDACLQQIVGRAIRYRSHHHLPPDQRKVNVYFMKLVKPTSASVNDTESGDTMLYNIIDRKCGENILVNRTLKNISI